MSADVAKCTIANYTSTREGKRERGGRGEVGKVGENRDGGTEREREREKEQWREGFRGDGFWEGGTEGGNWFREGRG